ncbi:MAG: PLP-dependent aminotransferase family protein [Bacteroidales bacterium]
MIKNVNDIFSSSAQRMQPSAIRECLKLTQQPDIISFAGGLPAPESFPVKDLKDIAAEVMQDDATAALQYTTTEGDKHLREQLVQRYRAEGCDISLDNVVVSTASQQALDLLGKIFIDAGDRIICGLPSYLGGLSAFQAYGANLTGIPFDAMGMRSDLLEETLKELKAKNDLPKFIYLIPDFQNPAGITMPKQRRIEILDIAKKYDILIIEDSPYREIRFEGEAQPMLYSLDNSGHVITLGTFSKTLAPGFRLGWLIGHPDILAKYIQAKQSADLCTSTLIQKMAARYLEKGLMDKNLKYTIRNYREKRDLMLDGFRKHMPEGVSWTEPEGGLFLFLYLPKHMDATDLFYKAVEQKVAFVQGEVFHSDGSGKNTMRINFSFVNKEKNAEGVKRLAKVIKDNM